MSSNYPISNKSKYNDTKDLDRSGYVIGVGRVTDIILDPSHPQWESSSDIGRISYQLLYKSKKTKNSTNDSKASPLEGNIKAYPIIGECVLLILGPSRNLNDDPSATQAYYLHPFNIWNETHNNAFPDKLDYNNQVNQYAPNSEILNQGPSTPSGVFNYGGTQPFPEQSNINPLQPFAGDIIFEGRWGQSIRFGRTVFINNEKFSTKGGSLWPGSGKKDGSPITIITNSRKKVRGYSHVLEDIDGDGTSVYLTSDQNISIGDIKNSRYPGSSIKKTNAPSVEYYENQAIISSDRLVFNSRKDFILFYGKKGIALSSKKYINLDSDKMVSIHGVEGIELGANAKEKGQPVVLSQNLIDILSPLIESLNSFAFAVSGMSTTPATAIPLMVSTGKDLGEICKNIISRIQDIKSENTFTR